jgi:GNAT superfamily N-acetyltransferase
MNLHLGYQPGCIGRVVEMHATYYARSAGFGASFEAKVASELAEFCLRYEPDRDGLWLAQDQDVIHGSVAIDGSHHLVSGAHLRWFITSDESRGQGVGSLLLEAALAFCRARRYSTVYLWTFEGLSAARHLYEKNGFKLASTKRGSQWGTEVNEQRFTLSDA